MSLIVYCQGGDCESSKDLAYRLKGLGYLNIRHFTGGFEEWEEAGMPIQKGLDRGTGADTPLPPVVDRAFAAVLLDEGAVAVDVRPRAEFEKGRLPGAVNIVPEEEREVQWLLGERVFTDTPLILYGDADAKGPVRVVAQLLRDNGYTELNYYPAGYADWEAAGETAERGDGS
jgi:rhodanese-related sulfurtransferase